jgi:hypothetical protein
MQANSTEARRYALGLLLAGLSPEEVEVRLEGRLVPARPLTALTDPTNVGMQEVTTMAQPTARGPVDITGVTTRRNTSRDRHCFAEGETITVGQQYERVMRSDGAVESYCLDCFVAEFGERELYGA